jgi:toxin-antitoxin system PIN domain toxin
MLSFDTNIAVYAANTASAFHAAAKQFLESLSARRDVAVCELMLVELYLKLRNEKIFPRPLNAADAAAVCQRYRRNCAWLLIESAPVMGELWERARQTDFAFRRIVDLRLGLTLKHHGVTEFATSNERDFLDVGFARVWNPLSSDQRG